MKTRLYFATVILFAFYFKSNAQQQDVTDSIATHQTENSKFWSGFSNSFQSWDIPFAATSLLPAAATLPIKNKPFHLPPAGFEKTLAEKIGRSDGELSAGSLNPAIILGAIMVGQGLTLFYLDEFTNTAITQQDYERTIVLAKSVLYSASYTFAIKNIIERKRPDQSADDSFFSGHASTAFAGFSYLAYELDDWIDAGYSEKDQSAKRTWLKIGSYTLCFGWATYVAYSRMVDNKHYFGDVAVGALVGTGVSALLYHLHFGREDKLLQGFNLAPWNNDGVMMSYGVRF